MTRRIKIGVVAPCFAPGARDGRAGDGAGRRSFIPRVELVFHPQCFLPAGHFAGTDAERAAAFVEVANDPAFDAVWFARGGYGSCRIAEAALAELERGGARQDLSRLQRRRAPARRALCQRVPAASPTARCRPTSTARAARRRSRGRWPVWSTRAADALEPSCRRVRQGRRLQPDDLQPADRHAAAAGPRRAMC